MIICLSKITKKISNLYIVRQKNDFVTSKMKKIVSLFKINLKIENTMIHRKICRRDFLRMLATATAATTIAPSVINATNTNSEAPHPTPLPAKKMPVWKGFNLLNKFNPDWQTPFEEKDFEIMAEWGFNFARIPLSYWCWSKEDDWYNVNEKILDEIDHVVELGKQYKIHVNLNFHRAPGYCINPPHGKTNLFEDEEPLKACEYHWRMFAERYKSYSSKYLSFNLINEAPSIEDEKYERVARRLIKAIRDVSPKRTIIVDGLDVGNRPLMALTDVDNIIQSGRGYQPMLISHYEANWVYGNGPMYFPKDKLSWPLNENGKIYDKEWLRQTLKHNWMPWIEAGGNVHIGEFGCHNRTPHDVALAWLKDQFDLFEENGWGWSLWNLYGSFGVLDSDRRDVKYENYKGHKLDRRMMELLMRYK